MHFKTAAGVAVLTAATSVAGKEMPVDEERHAALYASGEVHETIMSNKLVSQKEVSFWLMVADIATRTSGQRPRRLVLWIRPNGPDSTTPSASAVTPRQLRAIPSIPSSA